MDDEDAFDLGDLPISDRAKAAIVRRHLNWPADKVFEASDECMLAYLPHASPAGFILSPVYQWVHDCGVPARKRINRHKRAYSSPELPTFRRATTPEFDRGRGRARTRAIPPIEPEDTGLSPRQALARTPGALRRAFVAAAHPSAPAPPSTVQLATLSSFIDFLCVYGHFAPAGSQATSLYTRSPSASPAPPHWSPSTSRSLSRVRAASRSVSRSASRAPSHTRLAPVAFSPPSVPSAAPGTRLLVPDEQREWIVSADEWEDLSSSRSALFSLSRTSPYNSSDQSPLRSRSASGSGSGGGSSSNAFASTFMGRPLSVVERYLDSASWAYDRYRPGRGEGERTPLLPSDAMGGRNYGFLDRRGSRPARPVRLRSTFRTSALFTRHLLTPIPLLLFRPSAGPQGMPGAILAVAAVAIASTYIVARARPGPNISRALTEGLGVLGDLGLGAVSLSLAAAYLSDLAHLAVDLHPWWGYVSLPGLSLATQAPHAPPRDVTRLFAFPPPEWVYAILVGAILLPSVLARHSRWVRWVRAFAEVALATVLMGTSCVLYAFPARDAAAPPLTILIPLAALALCHLGPVPDLVAKMVYPAYAPRALVIPLLGLSALLTCASPPRRLGESRHREHVYAPLVPSALDLLPHEAGWVFKAAAVGALVLRTPTHLARAILWIEQRWMPGRSGKYDPWIKARKNMVRLGVLALSTAVAAYCVQNVLILASILGVITTLPSFFFAPILAWSAPTCHAKDVLLALACTLGAAGLVLSTFCPFDLWC